MKKLICVLSAAAFMAAGFTGCGSGDSIATVNGEKIPEAEYAAYLKFKRINPASTTAKESQLTHYLNQVAMADIISEMDLPDKEILEAEKKDFQRNMMINRYFDRFLNEKVDETAIENYYKSHSDQYVIVEADVSHILIRTRPAMSASEIAAKKTRAAEALSMVNSGRKSFEDAVTIYSEDKISARKQGNLGWLRKGAVAPSFTTAAFETLEPGSISGLVETPFGFHIIRLNDGPRKTQKPLNKVSGDIRYLLRKEARAAESKRIMAMASIQKNTVAGKTDEK